MVHMCEWRELTWTIMRPYLLVMTNSVARSVTFWPTPIQTCPKSKPNRLKSQWRCTQAFFALPHLLGIPAGIVEPPHMKANTKVWCHFPQEFPLKHGNSRVFLPCCDMPTLWPFFKPSKRQRSLHESAQPQRLHANAAHSHALQPAFARRQTSQPHEPSGAESRRFLFFYMKRSLWLSVNYCYSHIFQFQRSCRKACLVTVKITFKLTSSF